MRKSKEALRSWSRLAAAALAALVLAACSPAGGDGTDTDTDTARAEEASAHSHGGSGGTCFICDPAKRDPERLWCREHGRYEDRCWICHPELRDPNRPYCKEHGLYEDECFLCRPGSAESAPRSSASAGDGPSGIDGDRAPGLFCREHGVMERECGICQPQLAADLRPGESLKVRFPSELSASKAGVRTSTPRPSESRGAVAAFSETRYNENELARITPLAPGLVRRVMADVGAEVAAGETLAEIHSAEVAAAKTAYITAVVDYRLKEVACRREERLVEKNFSARREYEEAKAACDTAELAVKMARQKLLNYGLTAAEIDEVEAQQDASALLEARAPDEGTIVERRAVVGESVTPGHALFTLADLGEMWLDLSIPADRAVLVEKGLGVEARFASLPGFVAEGEIVWVDASIDERSRMVKARAVVPNAARKLKAGMFGEARILLDETALALSLPRSAIQRLEGRPYVFVKLEDDLYALRRVLLGADDGRSMDVLEGIRPDDAVVVEGAFTVMSEFLKSRLGAGCVEE